MKRLTSKRMLPEHKRCNFQIKNKMSKENKTSDKQQNGNDIAQEPDYRTEKGEWLVWNMLEYGNDINTACQLLRQKEIVGNF